ncbi:hypothetical protein RQP53_22145 [Paucibacter sp. APW11]|uniref:Solute-binding protein family 3/N-terminal domain-containing protein n=1 Tax=Roseateles aquae TaxID=3077235 RepID=A0ABU3PHE5_9BURK|nr:hypothetical protein [Paucibacter sp. APW11]MDT9001995.1 hypothetical protein [Paucibacter sp. APW11]
MMRTRNLAALLAGAGLALLVAVPSRAQQPLAEPMLWLLPEFDVDEAQQKANADKHLLRPLTDYLIQHWPEEHHELLVATVRRRWKLMASAEKACILVALRTPEREAIAYFLDTNLYPPVQLIAPRSRIGELPRNAQGEVDLAQLLRLPSWHGALIEGRSYGPKLDALLSQAPPSALSYYTPRDFGERLLQMVQIGRADYTIEFDSTLSRKREQSGTMQELLALPIQGIGEPLVAAIACVRNDWGRQALVKIDALLRTPKGVAALRQSFDRWMTPETRARYLDRLEAYHAQRLRGVAASQAKP